jgi:hypothetical protein
MAMPCGFFTRHAHMPAETAETRMTTGSQPFRVPSNCAK